MGARYNDARVVADAFIEAMGPNDLMDLMIFDVEVVLAGGIVTPGQRAGGA